MNTFSINPEKATSNVTIAGVMLASLFVALSVIFLEPERFDVWTIAQLALAIPLLFVACLAYAKIGYWKENKLWDTLGYFTNTSGDFLLINAIGLMISKISIGVSLAYFTLTIVLMLIYTIINVIYKPHTLTDKSFKFLFSLLIMIFGGILPLLGVY